MAAVAYYLLQQVIPDLPPATAGAAEEQRRKAWM